MCSRGPALHDAAFPIPTSQPPGQGTNAGSILDPHPDAREADRTLGAPNLGRIPNPNHDAASDGKRGAKHTDCPCGRGARRGRNPICEVFHGKDVPNSNKDEHWRIDAQQQGSQLPAAPAAALASDEWDVAAYLQRPLGSGGVRCPEASCHSEARERQNRYRGIHGQPAKRPSQAAVSEGIAQAPLKLRMPVPQRLQSLLGNELARASIALTKTGFWFFGKVLHHTGGDRNSIVHHRLLVCIVAAAAPGHEMSVPRGRHMSHNPCRSGRALSSYSVRAADG